MVKRRLLDTDTLSYILKQREPVASKARAYISDDGDIAISAITFYEILRVRHSNCKRLRISLN